MYFLGLKWKKKCVFDGFFTTNFWVSTKLGCKVGSHEIRIHFRILIRIGRR